MMSLQQISEKELATGEMKPLQSLKWTKLLALVGVWMSMGMAQSLIGPTLPDVREKVGITVEEAGRAFAVGGVGGILGALLGSLADRYNHKADLMLATLVWLGAAACILKPWCNNLWTFSIICFIEGIAWTCVNTVGNPMIPALWGEKSGSPMLALHFGYPLGAMIGPLVAYPFVSKPISNGTEVTTTAPYITTDAYRSPNYNSTTDSYMYSHSVLPPTEETLLTESTIEIAYAIVGLFGICNGVVFIFFQFCCKTEQRQLDKSMTTAESTSSWKEVFSPKQWGGGDAMFGGIMVTTIMVFYFVNMAAAKASGLYFPSYAVEGPLEFTNQEATLYSSAFNLAGTLGRVTGMIAAVCIPTAILFPIVVCGQALGSVTILLWGLDDKLGFVLTSCIYSYMSFPVWPLGYAWADIYIVLLSIVIGLTDVTAKLADACFGYLLGYLYEYTVKESIFYNTAACSVALIGVMTLMAVVGKKHGSKYERMGDNKMNSTLALGNDEWTNL